MGRPLRTFVALRLGEDASERIHARALELAAADAHLHVPAHDALHLTLHFLGDTDVEEVHRIAAILRRAVEHTPPFEVGFRGLSAFPAPDRPRVLHTPVVDLWPGDVLLPLAERIGIGLEELGFPRERRRYQPHITLGRLRGQPSAATLQALAAGADEDLGTDFLSSLRLISSQSGDPAYHYIDLTTIPLVGEPPASTGS
jgi:2'-5' RNA ligase